MLATKKYIVYNALKSIEEKVRKCRIIYYIYLSILQYIVYYVSVYKKMRIKLLC